MCIISLIYIVRCPGINSVGICIDTVLACNGVDDCGDNTDEDEAWCSNFPCDGMCLSLYTGYLPKYLLHFASLYTILMFES